MHACIPWYMWRAPLKVLGIEEHALQRVRIVDAALQRVLRQQLHARCLRRPDDLLHQLCGHGMGHTQDTMTALQRDWSVSPA